MTHRWRTRIADLSTGKETVVDSDPLGQVDVDHVLFDEASGELLMTRYVGDTARLYPRTPDMKALLAATRRAAFPSSFWFTAAPGVRGTGGSSVPRFSSSPIAAMRCFRRTIEERLALESDSPEEQKSNLAGRCTLICSMGSTTSLDLA